MPFPRPSTFHIRLLRISNPSIRSPSSRAFSMSSTARTERPPRPWIFAPLNRFPYDHETRDPILKGVVFDVDGTLCEPQTYMFATMRTSVGIPPTSDILDHIYNLPTEAEREAAMEKIRAIEREAMQSQKPQPGLRELMTYLESKSIPKAICTRNFETPVRHLLDMFLERQVFDPIVTRDFRPPKPDPAGILHIAKCWGRDDEGRSLIMVGDSLDDMTAGFRAGTATVLLLNNVNAHLATHEHTDVCIRSLDELISILDKGFRRMKPEEKVWKREAVLASWMAQDMVKDGTAEQTLEREAREGKAEETWEGEGKVWGEESK